MAIDIFEPLKDLQGNKLKSASWYRNAVSLIADRSSAGQLFKSGKQLGRPSAGRMAMFYYDPKTKQRNILTDLNTNKTNLDNYKKETIAKYKIYENNGKFYGKELT